MRKEEERRRGQGRRLAEARKAAGFRSARDAALSNGWAESTYRTHESGSRTIGLDDAEKYARRFRAAGVDVTAQEILFGSEEEQELADSERQAIPVMGYVGAGGDVEPEYEQIPHDGLEQIELSRPLGLLDDPIGFLVRGDSMYPRFRDGNILIVEREQPWTTDSMIGDEAVVLTSDGQRFVKIIRPGSRRHRYNLESVDRNFMTLEDVGVRWASPVRIILPSLSVGRTRPRAEKREDRPSPRLERGRRQG